MTREEEKELASEEYIKSTLVGSPYIKKTSFKRGVEWADEHPVKPQLSARDRGFIDEIIYALEALEDEKKLYFGEEKEFLKKIRKLCIDSDDYYAQIDCFTKGVEWSDTHPRKGLVDIEKTLKWLESCRGFILTAMDIEQFKKYMEE